jgi:DNA replication and repair protein RecF
VFLSSIAIEDFRCVQAASIECAPEGTTVLIGPNGSGKSSVLEAVGYLATLRSFRNAPRETMIRLGAPRAILRGQVVDGERRIDLEASIMGEGRSSLLVNRQVIRRREELQDSVGATIFSPEDVRVVREGPSHRRQFLDDTLAVVHPTTTRLMDELDRALRQRAALLRQVKGGASREAETTFAVWDARIARTGTALVEAREGLLEQLEPVVAEVYQRLSGTTVRPKSRYRRSWDGGLQEALEQSRPDDLRRGVTTVGPHRDDIELLIGASPARTHASQGEQRTLALALRLAGHRLAGDRIGSTPILLLDDVFSELDRDRSAALLRELPGGQTILSTATDLPAGVEPVHRIELPFPVPAVFPGEP